MKYNKKLLEDLFMEEILKSILNSMKSQIGRDTEGAHAEGDDLLVELIETLAKDNIHEPLIKEIIMAYSRIERWYS
jgi:hypothetical protein